MENFLFAQLQTYTHSTEPYEFYKYNKYNMYFKINLHKINLPQKSFEKFFAARFHNVV